MLGFRHFLELSDKTAGNLHKWYSDVSKLSFGNIFGDKVRLVVPFAAGPWEKLKMQIESLKDKKTGKPKGYHVDLAKGIVTQTGTTLIGKPFSRQIKLGKVIEQELGPEEKAYYNRVGNPSAESLKESPYSIIVSRHPIDIVRMSDHDGIQSCHSPNGDYFGCAVSEAKGHGPVAYLVKTSDLKKVHDLQEDEIFADPERGIRGIVPISRIRLRKFHNRHDDYDLAMPEKRVYGIKQGDVADSFKKSLLDWARTAQEGVFEGRPSMDDFERHGGSYADNSSSELFNAFFGDKQDHGDADYEGEDDYEDLTAEWEREIEGIRREYKFENPVGGWADIEDSDGRPNVYVSGDITFEYPAKDFMSTDFFNHGTTNWKRLSQLRQEIKAELEELNLDGSIGEVDFNTSGKNIEFRIRLDSDYLEHGPDGFKEMMENLKSWDEKYKEASSLIRKVLGEAGYMKPSGLYQTTEKWDQTPLKNFEFEDESGIVTISSRQIPVATFQDFGGKDFTDIYMNSSMYRTDTPLGKLYQVKNGDSNPVVSKFYQALEMSVINMLRKSRSASRAQPFLPGMGGRPRFMPHPKWSLGKMSMRLLMNVPQILIVVEFKMTHDQAHSDMANTSMLVHYLDQNFNRLAMDATRLFHQMVVGHLG